MKILIFYTYNQGYLSEFFKELSSRLSSEGHEITNFSFKNNEGFNEFNGVKLYIEKKSGYFGSYIKIFKIIRKVKPDVILSNFSYVNPALLFGYLLGVKNNLVWSHSLNVQMESSKSNIFIKKQFLKLADVVIANSILTQKELHRFYNVPESKTQVTPFWTNILETKEEISQTGFYKGSSYLKIGCPGRLTAHKNQKIVVQALSKLNKNQFDKFHLYFAGNGDYRDSLNKLVSHNNLMDKVSFIGTLSPRKMVNFYKNMDVIILPSLHEAFGLVFIEAIALGTPVIVSSRFGALTFTNDKNLILEKITFNPESVESLVDKLIPYFEGSNIQRSCFKKLYNENFNKDKIYLKIKSILLKD